MKYEEINKLKKEIEEKDFYSNFSSFSTIAYWVSFIGNLFSIIFAYFFIDEIIQATILDPQSSNTVVIFLTIVTILSTIEVLKRFVFDKFSLSFIKNKFQVNETKTLGIVSLLFISLSFYLSISGAKKYSEKDSIIKQTVEDKSYNFEDSITKVYQFKIDSKDSILLLKEEKFEKIKNEIDEAKTNLSFIGQTDWKEKNKLNLLLKNKEQTKNEIKLSIEDNKKEKEKLEIERSEKIKKFSSRQENKASVLIERNKDNPLRFIFFSTLFEFLILFGIHFRNYYKVRSVREYDDKASKDPKFKQFKTWNEILDVIYADGDVGEYIPSKTEMLKIIKNSFVSISPKDASSALQTLTRLGVFSRRGSRKEISMTEKEARSKVREYFKIE